MHSVLAGSSASRPHRPPDHLRHRYLPHPPWTAGPGHRGANTCAGDGAIVRAASDGITRPPSEEDRKHIFTRNGAEVVVETAYKFISVRPQRGTTSPPAVTDGGLTGRFRRSTPFRGDSGNESVPSPEDCRRLVADRLEAMDDRLRRMDDRSHPVDCRFRLLDNEIRSTNVMTASRAQEGSRQHEAVISSIDYMRRDDARRVTSDPTPEIP